MLDHLTTEASNPASEDLDELSTLDLVNLINNQDAGVAIAVGQQSVQIAAAIDAISARLRRSGRLIYIGAGTSGRLGVLDAAECPPTFSSDPGQVIGLIAGGPSALQNAVEGAEDNPDFGAKDLQDIGLSSKDVVVGIATSGRTPYVIGGLDYARKIEAYAIGLTCNEVSELHSHCDMVIAPVVGPEIISGSTRMKAGTATKMVLNMLSTGAMIRQGKTFGNLMVDLKATNTKLNERARRIVKAATKLSDEDVSSLLHECNGEVKTAIVVHHTGESPDRARVLLSEANGHLRQAIMGTTGERSR
ncbi:N-acetylmuramic acid 6-phosphate etherase [Blastopirellula marina]|uniref:N-acetylmuramic acid 6-phosphate etherase n=1 Tax=Blastopirellula marina TaxID=124 RepID=A0A2S8F0Y2_9BACT|nr:MULTISPECIES: N-acetylmuramic acid 6-phosphate etherase [Pirellulaceae]PQO25799.1 N-acetylmuramic acid 6-phosphate etherase [Blastopirellula marina]RCS43482.1 N-acetylmuramic acid 6-phosphate etherase [Bremerella cremea]